MLYDCINGSYGRAVARPRSAGSAAANSRRWPWSALERLPCCSQRHSLGVENRCAVARSAGTLSFVSDVPSEIPAMGSNRRFEAHYRETRTRSARSWRYRSSGMLRRRQLRPGEKRGSCVGKTKRGKGTKIMAVADRSGLPVAICIESASPHEVTLVDRLLERRFLRKLPERLVGDMAYDSDALDWRLAQRRIEMISPHRSNRRRPATQDGRSLRRYKRRWRVERLFAWLQNYRRILVRYEYHAENYLGFILLGCSLILLRHL